MIRYVAISAVLVLGIAMLVASWVERDRLRLKVASVYAHVPPKAARERRGGSAGGAFVGVAPWALSALPECFTPLSTTTGSWRYVVPHLPAGARRVQPPARLTFGPCTISLVGVEATVERGRDRFLMPATLRVYRAPGRIAVLRSDATGGNDLRVYSTTPAIP